jgi:HemK-like putative methylase
MEITREKRWLLSEKYSGVESEDFLADVQLLEGGTPLEYVIGHTPFARAKIFLDSHPLIPRTETEYWVTRVLETIRLDTRPLHILDLCSGSGCIGIAALMALPKCTVDFAEIDERHHPTILKNIQENALGERSATIYGGDLYEKLGEKTYDYIFTNPPYIDPALDRTAVSVKEHEPGIALYGGTGGMEIITRIVSGAPAHLVEGGVMYLEHEPEQATAIAEIGKGDFLVETCEDQYHVARYTALTRKND